MRTVTHLVCFPGAGMGASTFRRWTRRMPSQVEVLAFQPPGREERYREKPIDDWRRMVGVATDWVASRELGRSAFFGHSLGALIAFEVAREMRRRRLPEPITLFASALPAPDRHAPFQGIRVIGVSDDDVLRAIERL